MAALHKVLYRPIEAAIRWSGLLHQEPQILAALKDKVAPAASDFPAWPELHLNTDRIYDAIVNRELPVAINGIATRDEPPLEDPSLMVRHVELKAWMERYYPSERPQFLFSWIERNSHPAITIDAVRILLFERDSLKLQLEQREREMQGLHPGRVVSNDAAESTAGKTGFPVTDLSPRSETTYLHIVGGLLHLLLGRSPSGQPYSSFINQEAVISAMIAHHGERLGITERTLRGKFAEAKRRLAGLT